MTHYTHMYGGVAGERLDEELVRFINEAVALELNVSRLYALFQEAFPDDAEFWQTLSIEEENHALLLKIGRKHFVSRGMFPREFLPESVAALIEANRELERLIDTFEIEPPSRADAFRLAVALEESAGEIHFQQAMTRETCSEAMKIFQTLNNDDKDHADRIRRYMAERGIAPSP